MRTRTLQFCLALVAWSLAATVVLVAVPARPLAAQEQQQPTEPDTGELAQDDSADRFDQVFQQEPVKGHGRKIVRPGADLHPTLVWRHGATRATLLALCGALLLALPIAGVYEFTSRQRTQLDRSLTQSILLLPPIVSGIVMVVQGSLALAFSLAGVATTVRFRSSLKDTNDAAYIFLAIAIGIAAGAQALDIAVVLSLGACVAALAIHYITLLIHHPTIAVPKNGPQRGPVPLGVPSANPAAPVAQHDERDAIITVSTPHDDKARDAVESLLDGLAKQWHLESLQNDPTTDVQLRYAVRTKKRVDADALVAAITAAGAQQGFRAQVEHGATPAEPMTDDTESKTGAPASVATA